MHAGPKKHVTTHARLQVAWWIWFGYCVFLDIQRISNRQRGCFFALGQYPICSFSERLSIYISLLILTTQALLFRILVPGMSNFVNASVSTSQSRHPLPFACCFPALVHDATPQPCSDIHQVLYLNSESKSNAMRSSELLMMRHDEDVQEK